MQQHKTPTGLLGGTFDPIHNGHLHIANYVMQALDLKVMQFIPNRQVPKKHKAFANEQHRIAMLRLALSNHQSFIVNDIEFSRPAPSYMFDTLTTLRSLVPTLPLCLILGADAFDGLNHWFRWQDLLDLVHLVIINRPDYPIPSSDWQKELLAKHLTHKKEDLHAAPSGKIIMLKAQPIAISSTGIREKIKAGEDASEYMPKKVWNYIQQHKLYAK